MIVSNAGERSRLVGVVLVLAFEGCCAGLPPRLAEQPELPAAEFAPCPRHMTGRSARLAENMPGIPLPSTSRVGVGVGGIASGPAAPRGGRQQLISFTYDRLRAVRDV